MSNNYLEFEKLISKTSIYDILKCNEEMKKHTSFKIGGPADYFVEPNNEIELGEILTICGKSSINFYIIGNGTNLLVSDKGFRGLIIKIGDKFSNINISDNIVVAGAGALLSAVAKKTAAAGLKGLEFASGIPGSLGGAIAMNAGAYNGEIKDVIESVRCVSLDGEIFVFSNKDMYFGYRISKASKENYLVVEATLKLEKDRKEYIEDRIRELTKKRTASQPLDLPSAGSAFKRPEKGYASRLIEEVGLKGFVHGGVMVSSKHSGFIVNHNNGTCSDVLELMDIIIDKVMKEKDIKLEPEVKIIGDF